jgi:hexosaminidase
VSDWDESHPTLRTDESYSLDVRPGQPAALRAATVLGALHGLETFSQLVTFDFDAEAYSSPCVSIRDAPRFPHRGLMMDTARHYEPVVAIRALVDSLPYAKLNVLHWHMVDAQSFPFQSRSSPRLWDGAFSPSERYTQADVVSVVEYARLRGVRVMVEFDMPGHNDAWCAGYPSICPSASCKSPLNVAANETFDRISALMRELTGGRPSSRGAPSGLFPDELLHLGGDEVNTGCWDSTPSVSSWLKDRGLTADDGYALFVRRVGQMALANGRRPVQWAEVFDHFKARLDPRTVVHVWKGQTNVTEVVQLGYQVIRNVGYSAHSWYAAAALREGARAVQVLGVIGPATGGQPEPQRGSESSSHVGCI